MPASRPLQSFILRIEHTGERMSIEVQDLVTMQVAKLGSLDDLAAAIRSRLTPDPDAGGRPEDGAEGVVERGWNGGSRESD